MYKLVKMGNNQWRDLPRQKYYIWSRGVSRLDKVTNNHWKTLNLLQYVTVKEKITNECFKNKGQVNENRK